jgi:transcriptional regulator with XRE-family HTH domain
MASTRSPILEADRRARRQAAELVRELRDARLAHGLSQTRVASAIGVSHQLISQWERGAVMPGVVHAARWGAAVGIDISLRAFPGGAPLRDAGHLRLIGRARVRIGEGWSWRTEVPVTSDPGDRRAIDAVIRRAAIGRGPIRIGLEITTRLTDAQALVRAAALKQEAAGLDRMLLVFANTRHNHAALVAAVPTIAPSFPLGPRSVLRALRAGRLPETNGILLL